MSTAPAHARVKVAARPLWQIRVAREWPRYLLSALAVAGLAASARFAIDPPRPTTPKLAAPGPAPPDLARGERWYGGRRNARLPVLDDR